MLPHSLPVMFLLVVLSERLVYLFVHYQRKLRRKGRSDVRIVGMYVRGRGKLALLIRVNNREAIVGGMYIGEREIYSVRSGKSISEEMELNNCRGNVRDNLIRGKAM